jgi:hypothetical protein
MISMHFTIRVMETCPELGLHPGDFVTFVPEIASPDYPLYVHRPLPANLGSLLLLLESGGAELLTPHSTVSDFAEAVGEAVGWTRPRLVLEKAGQPVPLGPLDVDAAIAAVSRPSRRAPEERGALYHIGLSNPDGYARLRRSVKAIRRARRKGDA